MSAKKIKDKRVKLCPNEQSCDKATEQYRYKGGDKYCTECATPLVLVCAKCKTRLDDQGVTHRICAGCEAEKADRKDKMVGSAVEIGTAVGAAVAPRVGGVAKAAAKIVKNIK